MGRKIFSYFGLAIAIVLGWVTGYLKVPFLLTGAEFISEIFLRLFKLISLPIVFLSIVSTLSGMKGFHEMKPLGKKVIGYTILTTIIAASVALILFIAVRPTINDVDLSGMPVHTHEGKSYLSIFLNLIPSNIIEPFIQNNVIAIALLAGGLGMSILFLPEEKKETLHRFFSALFDAVLNITKFLVKLLPIGVWAFSTMLVVELSQNAFQVKSLMLYLSCVVGANLIQGLIILPLFLKWKKLSPVRVFKGMSEALLLAFFSKSSNATLPLSLHCVQKKLNVEPKVAKFSMPLCTVVNMNACAGFILTTVLFVATSSGMTFSLGEMLLWVILATLAAIGNAGVPMGCFFLTSAFLVGMNVPLHLMGIILPFYALLDMIETSINVWSDACVTVVVDKEIKASEQLLAKEKQGSLLA